MKHLLLYVACALVVAACAPPAVRPAPFRARPDSVAPGDLQGPFDGRVLDEETGRPVAGAQVYAIWSFVDGYGFTAPAGWHEYLGKTDAEGRYAVPRLTNLPDGGGKRLASFRLVIFKRGYVAYRSDRRFEDFGPRLDFTQKRAEVRLMRWRSDLSHVKHLRYVGGGGTLVELTKWEVPEAAAELAGRPSPGGGGGGGTPGGGGTGLAKEPGTGPGGVVPGGEPIPAQTLLLPEDVKQETGFAGEFDVSDLGDEAPSAQYNSAHLRAKDKDEAFDVALRIWKVAPEEAEALYGRLIEQLPGVKETDELGDKSLRAVSDEGDIMGVAYLDKTRGVVVLIQCGASQCKNGDTVVSITKRVKDRVDTLWPVQK